MAASVRVKVPATSANLGPGFDALGVALRIYNTVTVFPSQTPVAAPMAIEAASAYFAASATPPFLFDWQIKGAVPRSRGLGSSVTVRLGILHGLNALAGSPLGADAIYRLCARLEGHPDNAAPAAFGGFTVARRDASYQRFPIASRLKFILLIPPFEVPTVEARKVLPPSLPFHDAVSSAANAAAIAAAFASGNYEAATGSFTDHLHQPYRAPLIPCLDAVIDAGGKAGALGGWLSGSGSTIACATLRDPGPIAHAMLTASGIPESRIVITTAENRGVRITTT